MLILVSFKDNLKKAVLISWSNPIYVSSCAIQNQGRTLGQAHIDTVWLKQRQTTLGAE